MSSLRKAASSFVRFFNFHILWPLIFKWHSTKDPDPKKYIIADAFSHGLTDNMIPVYEFLAHDKNNKFVFCFAPVMNGSKLHDVHALYRMFRNFIRNYADAGTVILTESFLPAYSCRPRRGTHVYQLWHACGAFKKWGYTTLDLGWGADRKSVRKYPLHNCYSAAFVSSASVVPYYASAFNCKEDIIKPLGTPRTDIFFDGAFVRSAKDEIRNFYDINEKEKLIVYAPTFRGENINKAVSGDGIDAEELLGALPEGYKLIVKYHPYVKEKFEPSENVRGKAFAADKIFTTEKYLCAADILITDYSSLIFEYSLLNKPAVFYAYDLENYIHDRDFFVPYEDFVPGPIVKDTEELVAAIKDAENQDPAVMSTFRKKYMDACDGHSTHRIINYIRQQKAAQ